MAVAGFTHLPGVSLKKHYFEVPLDYAQPDGQKITVFAREVVAPGREQKDLPWLVFFQGGPGFAAARPSGPDLWLNRALKSYRVLLLDQRGTGLSTPVLDESLLAIEGAGAQADYLKHFRADNIVRDAEFIREKLAGGCKWTGLGQSYGGFCLSTYLSIAPEGLDAAIICGGLPPLLDNPDEVYRRTYRRVLARSKQFFQRYPEDAAIARRIAEYLSTNQIFLPCGDSLTVDRFRQLGLEFGFSGGYESVHYLLEDAFVGAHSGLGYRFLQRLSEHAHFNTNPIYALLHESIYCQGQASNWSAQRLMAEYSEYSAPDGDFCFTGEMIYPWMFNQYSRLIPMKKTAELLAAFSQWPDLYDEGALEMNTVPVVAVAYYDDMYVDFQLSMETSEKIRNCRVWVTNEFEHNGLRSDGERILDRLLGMLDGRY